MKKKLILYFINIVMFTSLSAQKKVNDETNFYKNRIALAPETVFKKFFDAGMNPTNHVLSDSEQEKIGVAFSLLPPLHIKILKENLHSISFMDNMPNTALTSPVASADSIKKFNITFRAGILNETISEWATWKEKSLYYVSANPTLEVTIDAGNLDAFVYVLLHEATHVVDAVLKLTPHAEEDENLVQHTAYTKDIWLLFNSPMAKFTNPTLEKTRFRSGKVQPIISVKETYDELEKTPFVSLYGMASWYEDIAELVTIYHLTTKLNQPFVIYLKENGEIKLKFEPMKNKLVKKRLKQLDVFYS
ncbi:hypothetical protein [Flavobacterium aquatile]|uniref:Secreted protein n=1 Tax=Flavobacterium aquatile LMG 4008 = ATCC 11947 TaxID=1453498 RepID=A0A095V2G0_9FLAO|nr:hypothetical protein [Flavobacterium aquatile]KGD69045.1 hypothetical protein LG45_05290 [Flavobacterium aquatile LMG 4008 = ATCC 11947]OXA65759.1 hypothetical protein B0A61_14035 [Flavobacterium aquatile LMG 4008 = ATCC 11947]GEC78097.1 hypothetical protein FAQ01_09670 [Flavobacterium aquatile]